MAGDPWQIGWLIGRRVGGYTDRQISSPVTTMVAVTGPGPCPGAFQRRPVERSASYALPAGLLIGSPDLGTGKAGCTMPIDPSELTKSIGALGVLDPERRLAPTLQQVVAAAKQLFDADEAGLMLADRQGRLRWASASDQVAQILEDGQERLAQGPCVSAFSQRAPAMIRDISSEPAGELTGVLLGEGMMAALSVPVELDGSPIGTMDIYNSAPWRWDDSEIAALQTYAGLVASLLAAATAAQVQGSLANQLQAASEHRWLIEQAKGMLMGRERLDAQAAFARLRRAARSSNRQLIDVARDVLAGKRLPAANRPQQRPRPRGRPDRREHPGPDS